MVVGFPGLHRLLEGLYSFRQIVGVQEALPTTSLKLLKSHAGIVQSALIGIGRLALGSGRPEEAWYRFDDLPELVFVVPKGFLGALAFGDIDVCTNHLDK